MGVIRKRGRIWYVDYVVNRKRVKKRIGPSKQVAELALKDIEVKIAKNELGFLPKDSDLEKLFEEFLKRTKTNNSPGTLKRYKAIWTILKSFLCDFLISLNYLNLTLKYLKIIKPTVKAKGRSPKLSTLNYRPSIQL